MLFSVPRNEEEAWQADLRSSLRNARDLYEEGFITSHERSALETTLQKYEFVLPRYYASLIDKNDPLCPIRLQAIPSVREEAVNPHFVPDPLQDLTYKPAPRVTHRYENRALFHLTANCSMYCRFCFRKSLLNELKGELFEPDIQSAFDYFQSHTEIEEVIFSGGDPFLANPGLLERCLDFFSQLSHIQRIRFHTRVPVTLPSRVTEAFAATLGKCEKPVTVVTHFNHPKELTEQSIAACERLSGQGILLMNQSVLLRNVNDTPEILKSLCEALYEIGVRPYYLHHPDKAKGTSHFYMDPRVGLTIWRELRLRVSGYLIPRYVIDLPGQPFKWDVEAALANGIIPSPDRGHRRSRSRWEPPPSDLGHP